MRFFALSIMMIAVCANVQAAIIDFICGGDTLTIECSPNTAQNLTTASGLSIESTAFVRIVTKLDTTAEKFIMDRETPIHVEIDPDSLGLDTLLVRDSDYRLLLAKDDPRLDYTVENFLRDMNYTFSDNLSSLPADYGSIITFPLKANTCFIVTNPDGAHWLHGRCVVVGRVVEGLDLLKTSLPVDSVTIQMDKE